MKPLHYLTPVLALFILFGCNSYKQSLISTGEFFSEEKVIEHFPDYNVYIQGSNGTWKLDQPSVKGTQISGDPLPDDRDNSGKKKKKKDRIYDLVIITDKEVTKKETAGTDSLSIPDGKFSIDKADIKSVSIYEKDDEKGLTTAFKIVLAVIISVLLIVGLVFLAAEGSGQASSNSSNSSGNSGSGSCYIATMAYGSYDAPEVMVLRRFRDMYLENRRWGKTFIRIYYKYSPSLVSMFRGNQMINRFVRSVLNRFIAILPGKYHE